MPLSGTSWLFRSQQFLSWWRETTEFVSRLYEDFLSYVSFYINQFCIGSKVTYKIAKQRGWKIFQCWTLYRGSACSNLAGAAEPEQLCTGVYVIVHWYFSSTTSRLSDMCWVSRMYKMTLLYPSPQLGVGTSLSDALARFGGKLQLRMRLITRVNRGLFHVLCWPAASTFVSV